MSEKNARVEVVLDRSLSQPDIDRLAKVEAALVDLLRAPYMEWYPFAISRACALMDHPSRWPEERKPKYKDEQCVCGTRKES